MIVTTESNDVVAPIHENMPVMLEHEEVEIWLASDDQEELLGLLDQYSDEHTNA